MEITKLTLNDSLPLTCSRTGTCCFGKLVLLNPWELLSLAKAKKITPREFRNIYCENGGIRLRFNGKKDKLDQFSCSQYIPNFGCSVHEGRPLACRLYPLGRQIQHEEAKYIFQGNHFPCLKGCPEVIELPKLTVGEYLSGQETSVFENAQDAYLEIMQNIADIGFALLLDTELVTSGDTKTLKKWKELGESEIETLITFIGNDWIDSITLPEIDNSLNQQEFTEIHNELLQLKAQKKFEKLESMQDISNASIEMIAVAFYLAKSIGANPSELSEHWISIAKSHGAKE